MTPATPSRTETVLYAEDDENDSFFMQRAFTRLGARERLRIVDNGLRATQYLSGTGSFNDRSTNPLPFLLLLDVKMPEMSGLEVLTWVRQNPSLRDLCVVMLTSSTQNRDIEYCAAHGANAYLVKPSRAEKLAELMPQILKAAASDGKRRLDLQENLLPPGPAGGA